MKYYLIAGEASGDLHGSNLIKALKELDASMQVRCWGGDLMQTAGGDVVKHYKELAFMGFVEVIKNLPTILSNIQFCKEDIQAYKPDVLVLIDYPGFNLRIAKWAKAQGYKVVYYISPQVWAWKANRVKQMKISIDKLLVILPFEKDYFKQVWNWDVTYVGHPLIEVIEKSIQSNKEHPFQTDTINPNQLPIIALLPGSRKQEISKKLPVMLEVARSFQGYQFVVAKASALEDAFYAPFLAPYNNVSAVRNATYPLLLNATAALVTSGTATLETALLGVPEVVCYKGGNVSFQIAKRLVKVKYISLVNLIMDKLVVEELIQDDMTTPNLISALNKILNDAPVRNQMIQDYQALKDLLTVGGDASSKAASIIYAMVS